MNGIESVSAADWAALVVGIFGISAARLMSRDRLPRWVRRWFYRLGQERIDRAIEYAARLSDLSPEQRRVEAANYISRLARRELGICIPRSIANLIVEYAYQHWKRK